MSNTHTLHVFPLRYAAIADECLKFVLMNRMFYADRIEAGDRLNLCEYKTHGAGLTGRNLQCRITHVISQLEMRGLPEDHVAVSLEVVEIVLIPNSNGGPVDLDQEGDVAL